MYGIVQFAASEGGSVAIVVKKWITPRKTEVYWPPAKEEKILDKFLCKGASPDPNWKLYPIDRVFYETDDLNKAKKKLKLSEVTSDLQSEDETITKCVVKRTSRLISTSDDDDDSELPRPPPLKKLNIRCSDAKEKTCTPPTEVADELLNVTSNVPIYPKQTASTSANKEEEDEENDNLPAASPICASVTNSGFQEQVITLLCHLKTQNNILIELLKDKAEVVKLHADFKFPLQNIQDLNKAEETLQNEQNYNNLVSYLKSMGGRDVQSRVTRILRYLLCDQLATTFSFYGKRSNKKAFANLCIRKSIVEAVKSSCNSTDKDIEDHIKVWLKHAPERVKNKNRRTTLTTGTNNE